MVEVLLDLNADINCINKEGDSPLHESINTSNNQFLTERKHFFNNQTYIKRS